MQRFDTGELAGWVSGSGPRVLLLHGGPGMSFAYMDWLADELGEGFTLASYQQRGLAPSTTDGPFDIDTAVADAVAVLDALGWERAWLAGHSWGGLLLVHLLLRAPERCLGGLMIDPLGAVADGGYASFEAAMNARLTAAERARAAVLDEPDAALEGLRAYWPAYFASREAVPAMPPMTLSVEAYSGLIEAGVDPSGISLPLGAIAGGASPMPYAEAAAPTVARVEGAWLEVVPGAGHFPWFEVPGCVRAALTRLCAS